MRKAPDSKTVEAIEKDLDRTRTQDLTNAALLSVLDDRSQGPSLA